MKILNILFVSILFSSTSYTNEISKSADELITRCVDISDSIVNNENLEALQNLCPQRALEKKIQTAYDRCADGCRHPLCYTKCRNKKETLSRERIRLATYLRDKERSLVRNKKQDSDRFPASMIRGHRIMGF